MNFTAVILAGGESRRMGKDKAGVLYEDEPLWLRQLGTIAEIMPPPSEILFSGRRDGPYREARVAIVEDEEPRRGPLGGVASVLAAARHEFVLILAIDLPLISSAFLGTLLQEAAATGSGIVPSSSGRFQPLAAIYTRACLPIAKHCLMTQDHSMQRFIRAAVNAGLLRERPLRDEEVELFRNVNTPRDLDSRA